MPVPLLTVALPVLGSTTSLPSFMILLRLALAEVKFENAINRINSVANPRQIERVVPGTSFGVNIVYEFSGMPEVFGALLKALGIVLIGRITADLCKDAGESAIASGVELAVKTAVLLTALPLLNRLLSLLQEVLLL